MRMDVVERWTFFGYKKRDVVVKIADHSETSDNMGQGVAEQEPRKWGKEKKFIRLVNFFGISPDVGRALAWRI